MNENLLNKNIISNNSLYAKQPMNFTIEHLQDLSNVKNNVINYDNNKFINCGELHNDSNNYTSIILPHKKSFCQNLLNLNRFIIDIFKFYNKNFINKILSSSENIFSCIILLSMKNIFIFLILKIL